MQQRAKSGRAAGDHHDVYQPIRGDSGHQHWPRPNVPDRTRLGWDQQGTIGTRCVDDDALCHMGGVFLHTLCLLSGHASALWVSVPLFSLGGHHRSVRLHPQTAHRHLLRGPLHTHLELRDWVRPSACVFRKVDLQEHSWWPLVYTIVIIIIIVTLPAVSQSCGCFGTEWQCSSSFVCFFFTSVFWSCIRSSRRSHTAWPCTRLASSSWRASPTSSASWTCSSMTSAPSRSSPCAVAERCVPTDLPRQNTCRACAEHTM